MSLKKNAKYASSTYFYYLRTLLDHCTRLSQSRKNKNQRKAENQL